jgi:nucleotide-binding universal stress UspA family protein
MRDDRVSRIEEATMKPIVLATDGSPSAAEATLKAVELAQLLDAPLVAVAVEHVTIPSYGYFGYAQILAEAREIERVHVDETLAHAKDVASEAGVDCDTIHGTGPVVDAICETARRHRAQLIVIGAHGWGPIKRAVHGSVSTGVLHEAPCPVLVVRGGPEALLETAALDEAVVRS